MKFAIVILNWNGKKLLQQFLPSVLQNSDAAEIYVADNASSDDSVNWLKNTYPSVKIIQNLSNGGYAQGYNNALRKIDAEIFCLLNSDVQVSPNWLPPVLRLFEENASIAAVQPKIRSYKNPDFFEYAGAAGGFLDRFGYPYCRGRIFDTIERDNGQYDTDEPIFWASGACLFLRSKDFWAVGGFDESFFAHQEEIDLCWRLQRLGKQVYLSHQSVVYHLGGATLSASNPQKIYLNFRNNLIMMAKNLPKNQLVVIIFIRLILDGLAGIRFLFQEKFSFVMAIVRAHGYFYYRLLHFKIKRKGTFLKKYYRNSFLLSSYFLKGKKYFSEL